MPDLSRFALNQITTPKWSMGEAIEGLVRHGVPGIGVWRQFIDDYGTAATAKHLKDAGLWVASYCTGAWFNRSGEAGLRAAIDENKAVFDQAAEVGAPCVVMVVGGLVEGSTDLVGQRARVRDGLAALQDHARGLGVTVALEPLHPMYAAERACLNTLKQANDLCDELGEGYGTIVDVYHCWWDPELEDRDCPGRRSARVSHVSTSAIGGCRPATCATGPWSATGLPMSRRSAPGSTGPVSTGRSSLSCSPNSTGGSATRKRS